MLIILTFTKERLTTEILLVPDTVKYVIITPLSENKSKAN